MELNKVWLDDEHRVHKVLPPALIGKLPSAIGRAVGLADESQKSADHGARKRARADEDTLQAVGSGTSDGVGPRATADGDESQRLASTSSVPIS